MTDQTVKELIKSFAYGAAAKSLAAVGRMTAEDAEKFQEEHAAEIEEKKAELEGGGWNE